MNGTFQPFMNDRLGAAQSSKPIQQLDDITCDSVILVLHEYVLMKLMTVLADMRNEEAKRCWSRGRNVEGAHNIAVKWEKRGKQSTTQTHSIPVGSWHSP
ncbi:hypothetical protein VNO77_05912 [Canavalia gladiata]|uniref:Uncharacterized protein n=1 Tax=Canavalia gladiata TaxID=3824 RepID=A0AAN9N4F0_CANGL